MGAIKSLTI